MSWLNLSGSRTPPSCFLTPPTTGWGDNQEKKVKPIVWDKISLKGQKREEKIIIIIVIMMLIMKRSIQNWWYLMQLLTTQRDMPSLSPKSRLPSSQSAPLIIIIQHGATEFGISLWSTGVSCLSSILSMLLVHSQPPYWGAGVRSRKGYN